MGADRASLVRSRPPDRRRSRAPDLPSTCIPVEDDISTFEARHPGGFSSPWRPCDGFRRCPEGLAVHRDPAGRPIALEELRPHCRFDSGAPARSI
jgi:hypothetical protein